MRSEIVEIRLTPDDLLELRLLREHLLRNIATSYGNSGVKDQDYSKDAQRWLVIVEKVLKNKI